MSRDALKDACGNVMAYYADQEREEEELPHCARCKNVSRRLTDDFCDDCIENSEE